MYEAWGHRSPLARLVDPPHLVEWQKPQQTGTALCGVAIAPRKLQHVGHARSLGVETCSDCERAMLEREPAPVLDLNGARRRRPRTRRPR